MVGPYSEPENQRGFETKMVMYLESLFRCLRQISTQDMERCGAMKVTQKAKLEVAEKRLVPLGGLVNFLKNASAVSSFEGSN